MSKLTRTCLSQCILLAVAALLSLQSTFAADELPQLATGLVVSQTNLDKAYISKRDDLPPAIKKFYTGNSTGITSIKEIFAEGSEPWVSGCVRTQNVPAKHLEFYAHSGSMHFVYYSQGGFALMYMVDIFELSPSGSIKSAARATPAVSTTKKTFDDWRNLKDLRAFIAFLKDGAAQLSPLKPID